MSLKVILLICIIVTLGSAADKYGYLPNCPMANGPLYITEEAVNKNMYAVLQIHEPATDRQIAYTHRRRYVMNWAARGIGMDHEVNFKRRKTMVFMDGYTDSAHMATVRVLAGNFAAMGYNTIAVDAQPLYLHVYPKAVRVSYQVGNITAMFLRDLLDYGLRPQDIELVGISLGGQTVSLVAKHFTRLTGKKVGKIFSMDPSGPCFRGMSPAYHLTPSDADMVQVIHTESSGFGMGEAQGHLDFYMNGGEWQNILSVNQPWCEEGCSHVVSSIYLYSSLQLYPDKFIGIKCKNVQQAREHRCYENSYPYETNVVGFKADYSRPGIYYVPVMADAPLHAPDDFMETKPVYSFIYNDALSHVKHFVLAERSLDLNISPPEFVNKKLYEFS